MRKVAESTVRRLSLYLRFLEEFEGQGIGTVSSGALASRGGTTSAQVRKDLSFFGSFGKRGLGYPVPELADRLREILGLKRRYRVGMIGAGKIGSALVQYRGFKQRGFDIVAIFDSDPSKVGRQWNGLTVLDIGHLEEELQHRPVDMAVLVVPADVPVDGFWSISLYNAKGNFEPNTLNAYTVNNITAKKEPDGSVRVQFGGCDGQIPNCLPITEGWNYMVRFYRPRAEILSGRWTFPEARP